jgi:hypothetical protein
MRGHHEEKQGGQERVWCVQKIASSLDVVLIKQKISLLAEYKNYQRKIILGICFKCVYLFMNVLFIL